MSELKLFLLGSPRLEQDDVSLELSRRKAMALLAYLATTGRAHSREALATLLWPDQDESRGRASLRYTLWVLKKGVGEGFLSIEREMIGLADSPDFWLDVRAFQRLLDACQEHSHPDDEVCAGCLPLLSEAVALYQDDFLAGFTLPANPEFDEWHFFLADGLRQALTETLTRLVQGHSAQGQFEQAIPHARRWLALDPLHEPAHRQLMQLYARSGQPAAAFRQYQICVQVLKEELGILPSTETTALYEAIKAKRFPAAADRKSPIQPGDLWSPTTPSPPFLDQGAAPEEPTAVFVARERELTELEATLETARTGQGQILFVIGGAGRGKTMLAQEFVQRAQTADAELIVISGHCNAHTGIGDPYLPFREALTTLAGDVEAKWAGGLITRQHARRLWEAMPITVPALVQHAPDLIGSFVPGEALQVRAATFAPPDVPWLKRLEMIAANEGKASIEQKRIFAQCTAALKIIAAQRPVLLILEDLHWVDAASSGLLFHLSRQVSESRILIVGTYRPEEMVSSRGDERHPLAGIVSELKRRHGDIWLDLGNLAPVEGRHFVDSYLDTQPNRLGPAFREALFQHTGGHALFTVELLQEMQERGDIRQDEAGRWVEGEVINWQTLPAKVEGVIEKRISRLDEALQAVLTVASVEGESFTAEVVARVEQLNERGLVQRLSQELDKQHRLVTAQALEWLERQRLSLYRFRHYLFQHYLYHSLNEMERTYLHEEVGAVLEVLYGDQTEYVAVQLARHFELAGLTEKAAHYLLQAGNKARRLSANEEALSHLKHGLRLLRTLPDKPERIRQELDLQVTLSYVLRDIKGYSTPEVEQAYAQAYELCQRLGNTPHLFRVLWGLWAYYLVRGDYAMARAQAEQLLDLGRKADNRGQLIEANRMLGATLLWQGELVPARDHLERVIALYNPQQHRSHALVYGQDPAMAALAHLALNLWLLGYPEQARQRGLEAVVTAKELAHPFSILYAYMFTAFVAGARREPQIAQEEAEAMIRLCTEHSVGLFFKWGQLLWRAALGKQGQAAAQIGKMYQSLTEARAAGSNFLEPLFLALLVELHADERQAEEGLTLLDKTLAAINERGDHFYEAELLRLKGELLLTQGVPELEAETYFRQAINLARQQRAKSLELRAAMSLSRLWQTQGKSEEARQMLAEIYGWFSEGFDTVDLKEAKALLEALS